MLDREGKKKKKKRGLACLFQDRSRITSLSEPLQLLSFQTSPLWVREFGERWLSDDDPRVRQWLHWLSLTPHSTPTSSTQHQLTWRKKSCLLLTGMSVCSQWVEFEPCIDYSKATPPQNPLQCLVDCLYTHTHKYRLCLYLMQILHFLWDIFTDSFLAQWKATKTSKGLLRLAGAHRVVWHVHSVFFLWLKSQ